MDKSKKILVLFFIAITTWSFSQNNIEKKQQIVNKIIAFQQNRFTKPKKAKEHILEAIKISQEIESKPDLLTSTILLGEFYDDNNNFNASFEQYQSAIKIANEINDKEGLSLAKYDLGILFYKQNSKEKRKKALAYLNESIDLSKETQDDFLRAKALNFSSFINYDFNNLSKAESNSLEALNLFRKTKKRNRIPQCYITLSRVYNKKDQFDKAIIYLDSAISIYQKINNRLELNNAYLVKSEIKLRQKKYNEALKLAQAVNDDPKVMTEQKIYALQLLYETNKAMNNHKKSLDYLEETKFISDSLYKIDRDKMMESVRSEIDAKNQLESLEKENEINELNNKKNQYWILVLISISAVLMLVAIVTFLIYRQNKMRAERERIKLEQESLQLEQKLLRTQMNPHFIANALAAIQGNIYKQDKEKSVTYLSKFAKLMRFILESSRQKEISLQKEITSLKNYLDLQKLLLEEKLNYEIKIDPELNQDEILIPPMLIQPFVENAIKHGIELKPNNGNVSLNFNQLDNQSLQVTIEDDGLGRDVVDAIYKERKNKHLSFSTNITKERIANLNTEQYAFSQKIEDIIKDNKVSGTRVILEIPIKNIFD
jgi:tetratricopeptide (TPR) repeat protein